MENCLVSLRFAFQLVGERRWATCETSVIMLIRVLTRVTLHSTSDCLAAGLEAIIRMKYDMQPKHCFGEA